MERGKGKNKRHKFQRNQFILSLFQNYKQSGNKRPKQLGENSFSFCEVDIPLVPTNTETSHTHKKESFIVPLLQSLYMFSFFLINYTQKRKKKKRVMYCFLNVVKGLFSPYFLSQTFMLSELNYCDFSILALPKKEVT